MASLLAPGVKAPSYALVRPKTAAPNALWAGTNSPGAGWVGTGGGWYTPPKSIIAQTIAQHPAWAAPAAPAPAPPAPTNPTTYSGTTATTPPPAAPPLSTDPRDSTYYANVNAHTAGVNNQIAGWQKQETNAADALPTFDYHNSFALPTGGFGGPAAVLAQKHATDVLAQEIAAKGRGGLYSTGLAQAIGNVDEGYQDQYTTAAKNYQSLRDSLDPQIAAAQTGDIEYGGGQLTDATDRAATLAANNPALGMPTTPLANDKYLIKGGTVAPPFVLTPPKGAPASAKWSGGVKPPGNWRGIGGGWWVPTGGK